ncbi:MAG: glycosyltransferase [Sphingopyxis sp.]
MHNGHSMDDPPDRGNIGQPCSADGGVEGSTESGVAGDAPAISIIIPHYNDLPGLDRCLTALVAQHGGAGAFEIIVADNVSPQGADAVARCVAGRARLTIASQRGAGPARNSAVAIARGAVLAFTDADCVPAPGWLNAGVAALAHYDVVGGAMAVLLPQNTTLNPAQAFEAVFAFDNAAYVARKGFTVSANLLCRRAVFDATGPFGVGLSEDLDWCHRAQAAGHTLGYAADAVVGHPARANWAELRGKWLRIQAETYALKPPTLAHKLGWLARAWLMPLSIMLHAPRIWRCAALHTWADRMAALRGLARLRLWRWADAHRLAWGMRR